MGMVSVIIDSMMRVVEPHNCYGVFRVTPKRHLFRYEGSFKDKQTAIHWRNIICEYYPNNVYTVRYMTYIINPSDFILLPEEEIKIEKQKQIADPRD